MAGPWRVIRAKHQPKRLPDPPPTPAPPDPTPRRLVPFQRLIKYRDVKSRAELRAMRCDYCGGPGGTVDHYMPICQGGANQMRNLVPCCRHCNTRKGGMHPEKWERLIG